MPCPTRDSPTIPGAQVNDLYRIHDFRAVVEFWPRNKAELVEAVTRSGRASRSLRALGSNWSLSEAGTADDVVRTNHLNLHVSQPFPHEARRLDRTRLRNPESNFLEDSCARDRRAAGRYFVHIEAGVQIKQLLVDLKICKLALPTMGSGAGQRLAGALSTGTHGADITVNPPVNWIQAVHLVGAGGQEWWITPEASMFANEGVLKLQDWCDDARIVANDEAFSAVCVAVGRMGVIYSMILEVQPAYSLVEVNLQHDWSEISGLLKESVKGLKAGRDTGIFDAPLRGLETGWFRSELLGRTEEEERETFPPLERRVRRWFRYIPGPRRPGPPPSPSVERYHALLRCIRYEDACLRLDGLAADLRGRPESKLHYVNIALNLANPSQCWIKRRWRYPEGVVPVKPPEHKRDDIFQAVIVEKYKSPFAGVVKALQKKLSPLSILLKLHLHWGAAYRFNQFLEEDLPQIGRRSQTSGEVVILGLYKLATDPVVGPYVKDRIIEAVSEIIGAGFQDLLRAGLATDILDTHDYELDDAMSLNSAEFFFDAASEGYLDFIQAVTALANAHPPVFGVIGIRFMPKAAPLLAMQRFARTVSVEVGTGRAKQEQMYPQFWYAVHQAANARGAIPHWGQEFHQPASAIAGHYGQDLFTWRRMLAELSIDAPNTFSTDFSREHGLEPSEATGIFDGEAVELFLAGLQAAAND